VDFFGDRARIDVHQRLSQRPLPYPEKQPLSQRPSQRSTRLLRPSLSEQVESILGHRSPSIPAPSPSASSNLPPANALGMAQLRRPTPPGFEAPRPSSPLSSSALAAPRVPTIEPVRPSSPSPSRLTQPPLSEPPTSTNRLDSKRPSKPSQKPS
jgi:hypothetical protein